MSTKPPSPLVINPAGLEERIAGIVEPDSDVVASLALLLGLLNIKSHCFSSGWKLLDFLSEEAQQEHKFDAFVVELVLAEENSIDLIRELQRRCPDTPVVATTLTDSPATIEAALEAGVAKVLTKPDLGGPLARSLVQLVHTDPASADGHRHAPSIVD